MNRQKIIDQIGLLKKMQEAAPAPGVNYMPIIRTLQSCVAFYDSEKYIRQVGELVLIDSDGLCSVTSDITCGGNKDNCFEITNPETGRKFQVSIKIEEI